MTEFALAVHVLEKPGRKHFSFKHASMGIDIFILVVFQVLAEFNRSYHPPNPWYRMWRQRDGRRNNQLGAWPIIRKFQYSNFMGDHPQNFCRSTHILYILTTVATSGSQHRLGVWDPLLSTKALLSPEASIRKKITTILQFCTSLLLSFAKRNSCCWVETKRYPNPLETGDERKDPKGIRPEKFRLVEDSNSEGKDGNLTVELQSYKKCRCVDQACTTPHRPLFQPRLCYPLLPCFPSMHKKCTPRLKGGGREGG